MNAIAWLFTWNVNLPSWSGESDAKGLTGTTICVNESGNKFSKYQKLTLHKVIHSKKNWELFEIWKFEMVKKQRLPRQLPQKLLSVKAYFEACLN